MNKKSEDEYFGLFQGAKISKREANKVGLAIILGFIGAIVSVLALGADNQLLALIICGLFAGVGYFWLGDKLVKK